jgi:hypothetical protein
MIRRRILPTVLAFLFFGLGPGPRPAQARNATGNGVTPPRLGFIDGPVSFWRPGAEDWTRAQVNTALAAGDSLYAGDRANFEMQIGSRAFVRAGAATAIDLTSLDPNYMQFRITGGHAALDLKKLPRGLTIEVDSPNAAFTITRPGYYRVDIDEHTTVFSARRGGAAIAAPAAAAPANVADNQQIILDGTETVQVSLTAAPALDEWDRWNYDRTAGLAEAPRSARYVGPDIAGVDDLDRYGDWREQPRYGHIWVPRDVPRDWAPYSTGRWVYDPYYEWTWVDDAPWGWAPYHYGRWVYVGGFWGWAPGPMIAAPVYSPALVAFFGAPGLGVSVHVGLPFMSWCALGFGEPIIPWWGRPGFVGRPYWGGWGGPRIVNNVVINNTRIVNVTNITRYQNVDVRDAVVAVDRNHFGRGRMEHVRLDAQRVQGLQPVHGDLRVKPVAASLVPGGAGGQRPPERLRARQVVSTRLPEDPMSRLRAKGIETKAPAMRPEPRIVQPQRGPGALGAPPQADVRPERPEAAGRQQLPPAPGGQQPPSGSRAGRPEQPAGAERPQPGVPGRAMPPPVPGGQQRSSGSRAGRPEQPTGAERPQPGAPRRAMPPPVPGGRQRPGNVGVGQPEPAARPQAPAREERMAPPPAARPQAPARKERMAPPPAARPQAPAREERMAPQPAARPQAPVREERMAPPPAARPQAPARKERMAPPPAARPQAPAREERMAPQPAARPRAPAREERMAPPPAARPQAPPPERAVPQQPSGGRQRPAAGGGEVPHDAPRRER